MQRRSDKHGPQRDEALKHELEGVVRGGHATHLQEWRDAEPSGEDQPAVARDPQRSVPSVDQGRQNGVQLRSALARHLTRQAFPGDRDQVVAVLHARQAPEALVRVVNQLDPGREFANVNELVTAVCGATDPPRF